MAAADFDPNNLIGLTNLELYTSEESLRYAMNRIGITDVRSRDKIISDGYESIQSIVNMHSNDCDGFKKYLNTLNKTYATARAVIQVYYSPKVIVRFAALLFYYDQAVKGFHQIPNLSFLDIDFVEEIAEIQKTIYSDVSKDSDDESEDVTIPNLKGTMNWVDFRDKFLLQLSEIKSKRGFPIDYLLDDTTRVVTNVRTRLTVVDQIDLSVEGLYRTEATQFGPSYKLDNRVLWNKLKKLLVGTTSYNYISTHDKTKNGRKAWKSLIAQFEGSDFRERQRELAFSKPTNTWYKGETNKFSFEKYVNIHTECHKMREDAKYNNGAGMDDSTKIQHFKTGIKSDANLEVALTQLCSQPDLYATFTAVSTFLSAEVDHKQIRRTQLKSTSVRQISKFDKFSQKNLPFKMINGKKLYAKHYSKQEFSAFSKAERDAVVQLNREKKRKYAKTPRNNDIKAISSATISNDDMSTIAEAIVAGVTQASKSNEDNESHNNNNSSATTGNADAGSVGSFIAKSRQNKRQKKGETK